MAISAMQKVIILAHRPQAGNLLAALQDAGIVEFLDAEKAFITKEWPELIFEGKKPRQFAELMDRLQRAITLLEPFAPKSGSLLAPRVPVSSQTFHQIAQSKQALELLERVEASANQLDKLQSEKEGLLGLQAKLLPWRALQVPLEQLGGLQSMALFIGFIPQQHSAALAEKLASFSFMFQKVFETATQLGGIWAVDVNQAADAQKILRSCEFEAVSFEGLCGTVEHNLVQIAQRLDQLDKQAVALKTQLASLAQQRLDLQILYDYYANLYDRLTAETASPATENVVFFEGWVKSSDFARLEQIVSRFEGCAVTAVAPAPDEQPPVEIDNPKIVRPFETVTRLYGMPLPSSVDPTAFLAPFFAIFFGLCIADAGYGLILTALLGWAIRKAQGDKKILWLLFVCSLTTTLAGAATGSWFGDAITAMLGADSWLEQWRTKLMLFDPMKQPMTFFLLSLGMGYVQIQFGLLVAFIDCLRKKRFGEAVWEKLVWMFHLNSLLAVGLSAGGVVDPALLKPAGIVAIVTSLAILLFSARDIGWAGRLGLGFYQLFSTVFYMGDVLSYARLMALGMVGSGFGMAINVLVKLVGQIPYAGWLLAALLFVGGHLFNIALSVLGAFVHTMRLQFVEFFPKFFVGGGREFKPLKKEYKYICVQET